MDIRFSHQPSYTLGFCVMSVGESLLVERDGMVQMSDGIDVSGGLGPGGVAKAALRKTLGRESFWMGRYRATYEGAWVAVAPRFPGDLAVVDLDRLGGRGVLVEAGALVAAAGPGPDGNGGVAVDVKWAGVRAIVLREGATLLHLSGSGMALVGSFGGIDAIPLAEGETRYVDTGHLVGFTDDVDIKVGPLGGVVASATTGEGLVAKVTGPPGGAMIWTQTRSEQGLTGWLFPAKHQNTGR